MEEVKAGLLCITSIPLLLLCCITKIRKLFPWLAFALLLNIVGILFILGYLVSENVSPSERYNGTILPTNLTDIPLYIGDVLYAFDGAAMVLPLENRMSTPGML